MLIEIIMLLLLIQILTMIIYIDIIRCNNNPCGSNAVCEDTTDSFICTCNEGFLGDGFNCIGMKIPQLAIDNVVVI